MEIETHWTEKIEKNGNRDTLDRANRKEGKQSHSGQRKQKRMEIETHWTEKIEMKGNMDTLDRENRKEGKYGHTHVAHQKRGTE